MQARLRALRLYHGPVDGILGDETRAALQAFQLQGALAADGEPSDETLGALTRAFGH